MKYTGNSVIDIESDDSSCPLEKQLQNTVDDFCRANAINARLIEELQNKFKCAGETLLMKIDDLFVSSIDMEKERKQWRTEKRVLEKTLRESLSSSLLPTVQQTIESLANTAGAM